MPSIEESVFTDALHENQRCELPLVGVTTTVTGRAQCIDEAASLIRIIVVGDLGYHDLRHITYLDLEDQERLCPDFSRVLPTKSFTRKSLGSAHSFLSMNACAVWDFDDDRCMSTDTRSLLSPIISSGLKQPALWLTSAQSATNP